MACNPLVPPTRKLVLTMYAMYAHCKSVYTTILYTTAWANYRFKFPICVEHRWLLVTRAMYFNSVGPLIRPSSWDCISHHPCALPGVLYDSPALFSRLSAPHPYTVYFPPSEILRTSIRGYIRYTSYRVKSTPTKSKRCVGCWSWERVPYFIMRASTLHFQYTGWILSFQCPQLRLPTHSIWLKIKPKKKFWYSQWMQAPEFHCQ